MINKTLSEKLTELFGQELEAQESSEGVVVVGKNFEMYVHAYGRKLKSAAFYKDAAAQVAARLHG